jgi:ribosome-associated translation inhibitor RaiA
MGSLVGFWPIFAHFVAKLCYINGNNHSSGWMLMRHEFTDFPIDFYNETSDEDRARYEEVADKLRHLAEKHHDITSAMVKITAQVSNRSTPHANEVTIRLYMPGQDVVVKETGVDVDGAIKAALHVVERQVREHRAKRRPQDSRSAIGEWPKEPQGDEQEYNDVDLPIDGDEQ